MSPEKEKIKHAEAFEERVGSLLESSFAGAINKKVEEA